MTQSQKTPPLDFNDPDKDNAEQDESGTQAQDVAADAQANPYRGDSETEHGGKPNPAQVMPIDAPDLVDTMNQMDRSGLIDMGAYEGEENMDDEDGSIPE
ncbi:hypothetical protein M2336_003005 [Sphingobium sp. B1D7B]|uniref:hypothetical protein n=1 Tax=unclassified Sphingobium TaxID=2611147 RepID=UPI0022243ADE|nr:MULTISPECIES: hypothetical protein [unclassified Sphingobium]MCW2382144.1 hypothetical protein [Sphingobium sp. B2D3B]MCW2391166.1 hypothetical protein [Sphingobium sp. B11D3A]MCW2397683.1 hypothetical protein [Sphingobium sp. B2D3C]MCW2406376.1 hypothetical protein [Sphingobium sp. B1D7B]